MLPSAALPSLATRLHARRQHQWRICLQTPLATRRDLARQAEEKYTPEQAQCCSPQPRCLRPPALVAGRHGLAGTPPPEHCHFQLPAGHSNCCRQAHHLPVAGSQILHARPGLPPAGCPPPLGWLPAAYLPQSAPHLLPCQADWLPLVPAPGARPHYLRFGHQPQSWSCSSHPLRQCGRPGE